MTTFSLATELFQLKLKPIIHRFDRNSRFFSPILTIYGKLAPNSSDLNQSATISDCFQRRKNCCAFLVIRTQAHKSE